MFQLEGLTWLVSSLHDWLASTLQTMTTFPIVGWINWMVLVLAALIIITILKLFIVDPLELHVNDKESRGWQVYVFAAIVLGLFLYILNLSFTQAMPQEIPEFIIKMVEGTRNTPGAEINSSAEGNFYSIFPWIWQLGPIIFMYYYASETKKS